MLCQTCSAFNDDDREYCYRCQNKLLVLSGLTSFEEDEVEDYDEEGDLSLDEHLLERVSAIEEIVKRSAETLRTVVDAVQKHERRSESTRLNSSHLVISYAVFCLKKKTEKRTTPATAQTT